MKALLVCLLFLFIACGETTEKSNSSKLTSSSEFEVNPKNFYKNVKRCDQGDLASLDAMFKHFQTEYEASTTDYLKGLPDEIYTFLDFVTPLGKMGENERTAALGIQAASALTTSFKLGTIFYTAGISLIIRDISKGLDSQKSFYNRQGKAIGRSYYSAAAQEWVIEFIKDNQAVEQWVRGIGGKDQPLIKHYLIEQKESDLHVVVNKEDKTDDEENWQLNCLLFLDEVKN